MIIDGKSLGCVNWPSVALETAIGWNAAANLKVGDALLLYNGTTVVVETVDFRVGWERVYNFSVAGNANYFVGSGGVGVHNCRKVTQHGAERMVQRGFSEKIVEDIINNNRKSRVGKVDEYGSKTWEYRDKRGNTVVTNENGDIVTVFSPAEGGKYIPKPR